MLIVRHHRDRRRHVDSNARLHARRNIEAALLGKKTAIVVELLHPDRRGAGETETHVGHDGPLDAGANPAADRDVVVVVGQVRRIVGKPCKGAEARGLEHLQRKDRRDADGHVAETLGAGHRNKHLLQIDAGLAAAEDARAAAALRKGRAMAGYVVFIPPLPYIVSATASNQGLPSRRQLRASWE